MKRKKKIFFLIFQDFLNSRRRSSSESHIILSKIQERFNDHYNYKISWDGRNWLKMNRVMIFWKMARISKPTGAKNDSSIHLKLLKQSYLKFLWNTVQRRADNGMWHWHSSNHRSTADTPQPWSYLLLNGLLGDMVIRRRRHCPILTPLGVKNGPFWSGWLGEWTVATTPVSDGHDVGDPDIVPGMRRGPGGGGGGLKRNKYRLDWI